METKDRRNVDVARNNIRSRIWGIILMFLLKLEMDFDGVLLVCMATLKNKEGNFCASSWIGFLL